MKNFLEKVPLYPFLIAIYPVIFLLSVNLAEISPEAGFRPGLFFLVFAIFMYVISFSITRNSRKSGFITLIVVLVFFLVFFVLYAPAYRWLRTVAIGSLVLGRHRVLVPVTLAIVAGSAIAAWFLTRKIKPATLIMVTFSGNIIGLLLILIPITSMVVYGVKNHQAGSRAQAALPPVQYPLPENGGSSPDIYYIILDMHTSDKVMRELMNYDDSSFTNALRQRGFYIPACSRSNYRGTNLSITSSMNMDFLQNFTGSGENTTLYPFMLSSLVERTLEQAGYKTYAFESGYSFTDLRKAAKFYQPVSSAIDLLVYPGITPFESLVMRVSGGSILYETREQLSKKMQYLIDAPYVQYRDRILYSLKTLPSLAVEPGPKFVFAHILAPHDPFVFNENGDPAFRRTPFSLNEDPEFSAGYGWEEYSKAYVEEVKYLHQRVLEMVDEIMATSTIPPVIILQGDHGVPRSAVNGAQFEIFNAYYLGGRTSPNLTDTVTPVNSFRIVFNTMFETSIPMLENDSYEYDKIKKEFSPAENLFPCP